MPNKVVYKYTKAQGWQEIVNTDPLGWKDIETSTDYLTKMGFSETPMYEQNQNYLSTYGRANEFFWLRIYPVKSNPTPPAGAHPYICIVYVNVLQDNVGQMVLIQNLGEITFLLNEYAPAFQLEIRRT